MISRRTALIVIIAFVALVSACAGGQREPGALIGPDEAFEMVQGGEAVLVDVRSEAAYVEGHLQSALSVPLQTVGRRAEWLDERERTIIFYCSCPAEETSLAAAAELIDRDVTDVLVLEGGIREWALAGLPMRAGARP
jgi:rhodanese-related sulfurtransferase